MPLPYLALTLLAALSAAPAAEVRPATTRVLLIGKDRDHPPDSHEYMFECELLAKCLRQNPGVEAVVSNGWPADPTALDGVKAIVLYTQLGGDVLLDPAHRRQFIHYGAFSKNKSITRRNIGLYRRLAIAARRGLVPPRFSARLNTFTLHLSQQVFDRIFYDAVAERRVYDFEPS